MVHATANLVSPVAQTCSMHKRHSKKRVLQIFFSVSFVLFLFAITGNMDSDSTQNLFYLYARITATAIAVSRPGGKTESI